jgi:hypothetical protein
MPTTIVDALKSIEVEEYQSDQLTIRKGLVKPPFKLPSGRRAPAPVAPGRGESWASSSSRVDIRSVYSAVGRSFCSQPLPPSDRIHAHIAANRRCGFGFGSSTPFSRSSDSARADVTSSCRPEHCVHERSLRLSADEFHGVVHHDFRHAAHVILSGEIRNSLISTTSAVTLPLSTAA